MPLGRLHAVLAADRRVYLRWWPASDDSPQIGEAAPRLSRVAAVACVEWAVRTTLSDHGWGRREVAGHLERACRTPSAADFSTRSGTEAVLHTAPPPGTVGPSVGVDVARAGPPGAPRLALDWSVPPALRAVSWSERWVAALWVVAAEGGEGETVHHALRALRGGFNSSGPFDPSAADDLVVSLLEFGDETAASERRAQEWRGRLRVV